MWHSINCLSLYVVLLEAHAAWILYSIEVKIIYAH